MFADFWGWLRCREAAYAGAFLYTVNGRRLCRDPLATNSMLREAFGDRWPGCLTELQQLHKPPAEDEAAKLDADGLKARQGRLLSVLEEAVGIARAAFELPPLDPATGGGVTDEAALTLLVKFFGFARDQQEKFDQHIGDMADIITRSRTFSHGHDA